ncbi:helix-turn-helix transcriptional regulator [Verrucomicrobium spinosum]|uniref:helix-turn-helix transcriptional regulator n=1 Tax=Verrucomicrobium spinosum TaxID=2736 RepID=UPI0001744BFF|nr:helix-turn-helix transcriptional regulator [Verrucomicrobium spinosum]
MSEELVRKLKAARERLSLTQKQMAEQLGTPLPTYIAWENDQRTPRGFTLKALLETLERMK